MENLIELDDDIDPKEKKRLEKLRRKEEIKLQKLQKEEELRLQKRKERLEQNMEMFEYHKNKVKRLVYKIATDLNFDHVRNEMMLKWQSFERTNDVKDWQISFLLEELDKVSLQQEAAEQFQMEFIDKLIALTDEKMGNIHKEYIKTREDLLRNKELKENKLNKIQNQDEEYLMALIRIIERESKELLENETDESLRLLNEKREKDIKERETGSRAMLLRSETLWDKYKKLLQKYKTKTHKINKGYLELKKKDFYDNRIIQQLGDKMLLLHTKIDFYKDHNTHSAGRRKKIYDMKKEKSRFEGAYNIIRDNMRKDLELDQNHIMILAEKSSKAIKEIETNKNKTQHILELMILCLKMETEEEKVLPFVEITEQINFSKDNALSHLQDLEKFYLRHSKITLRNDYLKMTLEKLKKEEQYLQNLFREIFTDPKELPTFPTCNSFLHENTRPF